MKNIHELIDLLAASASSYQAVETAACRLRENGFTELPYGELWDLQPGGKYYLTRHLSSLAAFRIPDEGFSPFAIIESHSDSPCLRIKSSPESNADPYRKLCVEVYGGPIFYTWFDRPLTAAGRVSYRTESGIESKAVNLKRPLFMIPSLAPHLNREVNSSFRPQAHIDLQPLCGEADTENSLMDLVAAELGIEKEAILFWDLFAVNAEKGTTFGIGNEYFSSPRIDNLSNVFASVDALISCRPDGMIPLAMIFSKEEIGSTGVDGADSRLLADVVSTIADSFGKTGAELRLALKSSFAISADNGHAVHPEHPEVADSADKCYMNKGIMIKQSPFYTTDGFSGALFKVICEKAGIPVQVYANRADMRGGSTLGVISIAQISVPTVDIGIPQLAMHSANETAGCRDALDMEKAMTVFFSTKLRSEKDSCCRVD